MERGLHAELPVTDAAASRTLALPMFPGLTDTEQEQVIEAVRAAVGRHLGPDARGAANADGTASDGSGSAAGAAGAAR
jgi:hypothetical protein